MAYGHARPQTVRETVVDETNGLMARYISIYNFELQQLSGDRSLSNGRLLISANI
jgi:hypothetical protein